MELCLAVDHECNLRCSYCYGGRKSSRPMTVATMQAAVALAMARASGWLSVTFFGGEPLLHLPLLRATAAYVQHAQTAAGARLPVLRFLLDTNATLIDDEVMQWFSGLPRAKVFVSMDGDDGVHDRHRRDGAGRGSHARALAGLVRLRKGGVPFDVVAVISPDTASALGDSLVYLAGLGAERILFRIDDRANWDGPALAGLALGLARAGERWLAFFRAGRSLEVEPFHSKILSHITGSLPCPARCRLAAQEIAVSASGRIYPCAEMIGEDDRDHLTVGHVSTGIDEERVVALRRLKERVYQACASCALKWRCQHHCGCRHLAVSGALGKLSSRFCDIEALIIEQADRVAETLWAENCSAFHALYYARTWRPEPGAKIQRSG